MNLTNLLISQYILYASFFYGVPPEIIRAVIHTESNFKPKAKGLIDDVGLMQVRHTLVPELEPMLYNPFTNIFVGTRILKNSMLNCKHQSNYQYVVCYNMGVTGGSKVRYPMMTPYYRKIRKAYDKNTLYIYRNRAYQ